MGIEKMDDPRAVRGQYASTDHLATRRSVWGPTADGRNPHDELLAAVLREQPSSLLDVGCGTGAFASRVACALPTCRVVAVDSSEAMVTATAALGIDAQVADVQQLPFADASLDVVSALWMLYHVPDLDRAIGELRRVLRPGGLLLVATNSELHLADLKAEFGLRPTHLPFSAENGPDLLRRHFASVEVDLLRTRATFDDADRLRGYLASMQMDTAAVADFDKPRAYLGAVALITCR